MLDRQLPKLQNQWTKSDQATISPFQTTSFSSAIPLDSISGHQLPKKRTIGWMKCTAWPNASVNHIRRYPERSGNVFLRAQGQWGEQSGIAAEGKNNINEIVDMLRSLISVGRLSDLIWPDLKRWKRWTFRLWEKRNYWARSVNAIISAPTIFQRFLAHPESHKPTKFHFPSADQQFRTPPTVSKCPFIVLFVSLSPSNGLPERNSIHRTKHYSAQLGWKVCTGGALRIARLLPCQIGFDWWEVVNWKLTFSFSLSQSIVIPFIVKLLNSAFFATCSSLCLISFTSNFRLIRFASKKFGRSLPQWVISPCGADMFYWKCFSDCPLFSAISFHSPV
jgi:hypothetical protein